MSVCSGSFARLDVIFDTATIYAVLVKHANAAQFVLKSTFLFDCYERIISFVTSV